ncbi:enoyl-CoA hydratase/isomerase family protein [Bacillus sp. REN3]|uniref:enoyl-CoA hydratase/isomerase family protein n=1 Tax=Bacillus sp. REN3 TaxID=2802440 RepID=UPI001AEEC4C0|nr:enoyl-CoA hydratase/isomerase family protein [Bacillus sp. REN3]
MGAYTISREQGGILLFTITKPERRNAVDYEVMDGLEQAIEMAEEDAVKVLAITGMGDQAFCSGGDLSVFHSLKTEEQAYAMLSRMAGILYRLLILPKPTIAVMNGTAVGGGCEIASACDFRIARKGTKAGFVQGNLAITTGWGGGSILLEKLPQHTAFKLLIGARIYTAEELKETGFIQATFEDNPLKACFDFLKDTLDKEVSVLKAYKSLIREKWILDDMKERMEKEAANCAILWENDAHHKKVEEFARRKK